MRRHGAALRNLNGGRPVEDGGCDDATDAALLHLLQVCACKCACVFCWIGCVSLGAGAGAGVCWCARVPQAIVAILIQSWEQNTGLEHMSVDA